MTILLLTIGTRGDVQPFVALAEGLQQAGHQVAVATSPRYASLLAERDVPLEPLSDDLIALIETPDGRAALEAVGRSGLGGLRAMGELAARSMDAQRALFDDGWTAARHVRPDLIVYHPKMAIAKHYAERLGIPAVLAPLFPVFLSTARFPAPGVPALDLGPFTGAYNRATYALLRTVVGGMCRWLFARWRRAHGLPMQPLQSGLLHRDDGTPVPIVNAWSRHVVPPPPEWPPTAHTTGYWFLNRAATWTPPPALRRFLDEGPAPVYVGFGSMAARRPEETTRIVLEALRRTGHRGVLARGWGGLVREALPDSVYLLDAAPHDWLFPRMAAVVHHGGAGTTAAGLRAGVPTVVCPFFGDQPFWGRQVKGRGVGPAPVPQADWTAGRLATALRTSTSNSLLRRRAEALGRKIRAEDGVASAIAVLQRIKGSC